MIDILSISKDASRLAQIVRLIGECGSYRTTRAVGSPSQLAQRGDGLDSFDVLIVDAVSLDDAELTVIAELSRRYDRLTCVLLTPDASPQTLIAAMRAGFRDVLSWPLDQHSLGEALLRAESKRSLSGAHETRIVSFVSCKGGNGTTLVASNVAHAISIQRQKRVLQGDVPSPVNPPSGCHFHTRCPYAVAKCKVETPLLREIAPGHHVSCHLR